ncbi:MAG: hypothetical protein V3W18_12420 [candidate division Zixibacteria bacterium]
MKRLLLGIIASILLSTSVSAQEPLVEIIFGPRDGDNVGTLYAYENSTIEVEFWMRTAPNVSIIAIHLPLSSKDEYVESRNGINLEYPPMEGWNVAALSPNDNSPYQGYTNQSLIGLCCPFGMPRYQDGVHTEGEWWKIASYIITMADNQTLNTLFCDAFIEGVHPYSGGNVLSEFNVGELDPSTYTVQYACLEFRENLCGSYIIGDFNGSGQFNVADIIASFSRLAIGSPEPGMICECPPGSGDDWAVAMDVNNSCAFNIADMVIAYQRLALGEPDLLHCDQCPPTGP